jgi:hypothetical protein
MQKHVVALAILRHTVFVPIALPNIAGHGSQIESITHSTATSHSRPELVCFDISGCPAPLSESEIREFLDAKFFRVLDNLRAEVESKQVKGPDFVLHLMYLGRGTRDGVLSILLVRSNCGRPCCTKL